MKNFIKNIISYSFLLAMVILPFVGAAAAESGNFTRAIVIIAIESLGCAVTFVIARYNEKAAKKAARNKKIALQRAIKQQAEKKAAEEKSKAYQNATFDFITSYANDEISSNNSTSIGPLIEPLEEVKIYLLAQNAISRYKRNTSR